MSEDKAIGAESVVSKLVTINTALLKKEIDLSEYETFERIPNHYSKTEYLKDKNDKSYTKTTTVILSPDSLTNVNCVENYFVHETYDDKKAHIIDYVVVNEVYVDEENKPYQNYRISLYEGADENHQRNGFGEYKEIIGSDLKTATYISYKGNWKDDIKEGRGIYQTKEFTNGIPYETYYVGQFANDKFNGRGKLFTYERNDPMVALNWKNSVYIGIFKDGEYVGKCE